MPPKKKVEETTERPKSQADNDFQSISAEVTSLRERIKQYAEKLEVNARTTQEAKKIEETMAPLEETKRRGPIKLRRVVAGDQEDIQGMPKSLKELHAETAEIASRILIEILKSPKTKSESDRLEKGTIGEDTGDLLCPPGICPDIFSTMIAIRHQRLVAESQLEVLRDQLLPLKEHLEAERISGTCRSGLKRMERMLDSKLEEQKEAHKRVQQEDDDWNRARQEQEWQNQVRAQAEGAKKK
eukprot:TRINITY_DN2673_c3_g1_i1.p1 TRINITY_DN2673_c3_g1~~TRINITY_DN2673_c3_g1_i1.p1  ORF type:complete len:262 (+),score=60.84 TRINITY_DN2673_c3_g1_i1:61-786(+)